MQLARIPRRPQRDVLLPEVVALIIEDYTDSLNHDFMTWRINREFNLRAVWGHNMHIYDNNHRVPVLMTFPGPQLLNGNQFRLVFAELSVFGFVAICSRCWINYSLPGKWCCDCFYGKPGLAEPGYPPHVPNAEIS